MARMPVVGRLSWTEYLALFLSLALLFIEVPIRIITLLLPQPVFHFFYNRSKNLFNFLSSPRSNRARSNDSVISDPIADACDFTEVCALAGYRAEEHIVHTADGYLLGIHRLPYRKGEERENVLINAGPGSVIKPVVYLHHGLLMNSEVWVCITEKSRCLPFALVERGYDVWLGNNRGNKYSKKSTRFSPASPDFWNFSMDQFAFHDIPDSIDYILKNVCQPSLAYIGFSQGTAQAFATLSIHPPMNEKINLFIALAPAMSPAGLSNGIVDSLVKTSPDVLFLAFGRKSILSSTTFWQSILYPPLFVRVIDTLLWFLFAWSCQNISPQQKLAAYPHLYSFTSTKSVVHWFQIIRNKSFQMYDDDSSRALSIGASDRYYKVAKFPTRNIKTPIVLVYGGSDSLVDIRAMLRELPKHTMAFEIKSFEHLDFLWARSVDKLVFPHVFDALRYYSTGHGVASGNTLVRNGLVSGSTAGLSFARADTARLRLRSGSQSISSSGEDDPSVTSDLDTPTPVEKRRSAASQARENQFSIVSSTPFTSYPSSPTSTAADNTKSPPSFRDTIAMSTENSVTGQQLITARARTPNPTMAIDRAKTVAPSSPYVPSATSSRPNLSTTTTTTDSHIIHNPAASNINYSNGQDNDDDHDTQVKAGSQQQQHSTLLSQLWPKSRSNSRSKHNSKTRAKASIDSSSSSQAGHTAPITPNRITSISTRTPTITTTNTSLADDGSPPSTATSASRRRGSGSGSVNGIGASSGVGSAKSAPRFSTTGIRIGAGRPIVGGTGTETGTGIADEGAGVGSASTSIPAATPASASGFSRKGR